MDAELSPLARRTAGLLFLSSEPVTRDALLQALDRLVAFQMRYSRPNRLEAPQKGCCVCLLVRRPTGHRTDAGTP